MKAAPVSRALRASHEERLVHSGQHWDERLSQVLLDELGLSPDAHLAAGERTVPERLAHVIRGVRGEIASWGPDAVLVYGDTDTTLAGALAAREAGVPLVHVEAGMRSGEARMPEEINRLATDHVAALLLAPTEAAGERLRAERVAGRVEVVGDVMLDALLAARVARGGATAERLGVVAGGYLVATVHRAATVDDAERLERVVRALDLPGAPVLVPLHPRTAAALHGRAWTRDLRSVRLVEPLPRGAMLELIQGARGVLTDSGGVQREAWFLGVPCATLRERTEWPETLADGWNVLVGTDGQRIRAAVAGFESVRGERDLDVFGGGRAAERIALALSALGGSPA